MQKKLYLILVFELHLNDEDAIYAIITKLHDCFINVWVYSISYTYN